MKNLRYKFFGVSHGKGYGGTIWGLPQGVVIDIAHINSQLLLRKCGIGRSTRQTSEVDTAQLFGLSCGKTTEKPLKFFVANGRHGRQDNFSALRSGHIDLVGAVKHQTDDLRSLNERASARSSLCYVVLGAIAKQILAAEKIITYSFTQNIGGIENNRPYIDGKTNLLPHFALLRCPDENASAKMQALIEKARENGDSLGGITTVEAAGVKLGQLGDFFPYEKRLDGTIAGHMLSIPSVKGIEFGIGQKYVSLPGSQAADKLTVKDGKILYETNNAGGIVAGITNGAPISFQLTVKPVPTLKNVESVDLITKQAVAAHCERADTCVVPTVGIVAENILAAVLLDLIIEQNKHINKP